MRIFKVIALSCSGKGNRIFSSKDEVSEDDFPEGTIDDLVAKGFLIEIKTDKPKPKEVSKKNNQ